MIRLLRFTVVAMCIVVSTLGQRTNANENLDLISSQTKLLRMEPIFVTLQLVSDEFQALPAEPGKSRFVLFSPSLPPMCDQKDQVKVPPTANLRIQWVFNVGVRKVPCSPAAVPIPMVVCQ